MAVRTRKLQRALVDLEGFDDVVGSGIFDPSGRATVHASLGVFSDHPSMPGYIARHPVFQRQTEVLSHGVPTMEVPGGGFVPPNRVLAATLVPGLKTVVARVPIVSTPPERSSATVHSFPDYQARTVGAPISGYGADPAPAPALTTAGWGVWAMAGALLGTASAILYHAVSKEDGR